MDTDYLIGRSLAFAIEYIIDRGYAINIVEDNGKRLKSRCTAKKRVNVVLKNHIVIAIEEDKPNVEKL